MALTNSQYNTIIRSYDSKQFAVKHMLDVRRFEIYNAIPEYELLDQKIVHNSIECAKLSLFSSESKAAKELERIKEENLDLSMKKVELLSSYGYPVDYLSPVYECSKCKDTGFIDNERCTCFKQAVIKLLYSESLISRAIEKENFDSFCYDYYSDNHIDPALKITPYENILKVIEKSHSFVDNFDKPYSLREHKNLLIYGNTGVGKTFLANCIAKEILNSAHSVVYITASELFDILSKSSFEHDINLNGKIEYINNCDLLIIDDLGTELSNSFTNSQLYSCINNRLLKNLSVIISTNYQLNELQMAYSERVLSRIIGEYTVLRILGDDIRIKKA